MPAAQFGLNVEAGATYKLRLTVRTGAGQDAPPLDLTGWQPRMQIRPSAASLDVLLDCRPENSRISVENGPAGVLSLNIPAADTARLDFMAAVYDLIIIGPAETRRLLAGTVTVSPAVTK